MVFVLTLFGSERSFLTSTHMGEGLVILLTAMLRPKIQLNLRNKVSKEKIAKITPIFTYSDGFSRFCKLFLYNQLKSARGEDKKPDKRS
jgi:hypothetical protein